MKLYERIAQLIKEEHFCAWAYCLLFEAEEVDLSLESINVFIGAFEYMGARKGGSKRIDDVVQKLRQQKERFGMRERSLSQEYLLGGSWEEHLRAH